MKTRSVPALCLMMMLTLLGGCTAAEIESGAAASFRNWCHTAPNCTSHDQS
ncbi:hypothetical protein FHS48_002789 [Novispirillum itersonii]|uniref:Lipoprotein n=1 Tax=Novispirillum itersonii TaxID=189 RepID=A0A7X0DPK2_NOVIT|nr:hypothetical protein [Novispirillum itersonii]